MIKKLLVGLAAGLAGAVVAAPAASAAFPQFWTDSSKTTLLRSVTALPKNQPDAMEFVNNGTVTFAEQHGPTVLCNEVEFGTTVLVNTGAAESKLAMPFGVAEGDNCIESRFVVPIYFDTGATGAVPATITVTGPPPIATVHKLTLSQNVLGTFCTLAFEGAPAKIENVTEGFVEESPPNLNLSFEGAPGVATCGKTKEHVALIANFFLETMSTTTDTAFVG